MIISIILTLAYLIGSIPNAVWIGKLFYKTDVRNEGSKNAGTTNVIRVLGLKPGICVLALDLFKGILPLALFSWFFPLSGNAESIDFQWLKIAIAVVTIVGHIFPIFAGFRGGKGVATLVGVLIMLFPQVFWFVLAIFFGVFFAFRYVSLSSITASISLPLLQFAFFRFENPPMMIFAILIAIFIPIMHHKNIRRLLHHEEPKFVFKKHV